ncbi:hypothetical protein DM01DRAFT_1335935 [Hesseltinella vesiculosa]|uniref:Dymeclin n=1 Tax=Hesseltinella vesiculosa TaxID=101127 RepID=A0A1X2GHT3_9FUNG|nr:hypothetical protein DM01DRAFT_1335935 [Hesseltinella vesiculosa]
MAHPSFPELTAPHRSVTSDQHSLRRPSLYQNNNSSPVSPNTSSSYPDLADAFATSPLSQHPFSPPLPSASSSITQSPPPVKPSAISSDLALTPPLKNPTHHFTSSQTTALKSLTSAASIDIADSSYWSGLLGTAKFPPSHTPQDAFDLEMETVGWSIELAANNRQTRNFNKLVCHLLCQLKLVHHHQTIDLVSYNALYLVRVFVKHFVGNLSDQEIQEQLTYNHAMTSTATNRLDLAPEKLPILQQVIDHPQPTAEQLLQAVLDLIITLDPNANYTTYEFYVELLNLLLVLFSTQLHQGPGQEKNLFLDILFTTSANKTNALIAKLLDNVIEQKQPPSQTSSMVFSAYNYLFASRSSLSDTDTLPVADRSLLTILLLCTQSRLYRQAIACLRDLQLLSTDLDDIHDRTHLISYKHLFNLFCESIHVEEHMLLFYLMLMENESFRVYVLSRTDPETMYIPILKMIYESIEQRTNFSQIYILMVILLIFSQDEVNNDAIQKVMVSNLTWFTERPLLRSLSLGSLTMLVLTRVLQFNLSHQKDIYFHTNCLAILSNMAGSTLDMHAYVAQRLTGVFELIARRYQKWVAKLRGSDQDKAGPASTPLTVDHGPADLDVYEDLLMLMLEIMNAVLTHRLLHNSQLIYCLLLKRDLFVGLHLQPRFSGVVDNIETVIEYFSSRVADANIKSPSTTDVLAVIDQASRTWSAQRLQPLDDLKFQYEEEHDCHQFFVPYVWAMIHRHTYIYWSDDKTRGLDAYRQLQEPVTPCPRLSTSSTPTSPH